MTENIEEIIEKPRQEENSGESESQAPKESEESWNPQDMIDSSSLEEQLYSAPSAEDQNYGPSQDTTPDPSGSYSSMDNYNQSTYQENSSGNTYSNEPVSYNRGEFLTWDSYE